VRQGSSLAPVLFSVYVNDVIANDKVSSLGFLFAFADDILLISLSVCALQSMLSLVEWELLRLDLRLNVDKCCCIRVGARFDKVCATLTTVNNAKIRWCNRMRYLGIWICSSRRFSCDFSTARRSFNRAANTVLSKVGATASEEVLVQLIKSKCIPVLLFGCEAVGLSSRELAAMDFSFVRIIMKIFRCNNSAFIEEVMLNFRVSKPSDLIRERAGRFNVKYSNSENLLCQTLMSLKK